MRYTRIEQARDGSPCVKVTPITLDGATAEVIVVNSMAPNYQANAMGREGLIPDDLVDRASDGWLTIACGTADEASSIAARIEATIAATLLRARQARRARVMEYIGALLDAGKLLYTRGSKGRFEAIQ
jgi:hypothetical protein